MSHPKLIKRKDFFFHPKEFAFLGRSCDDLEALFTDMQRSLPHQRLVYIDGDHQENSSSIESVVISENAQLWKLHGRKTNAQFFSLLSNYDAAAVNGNHFQAGEHILFCNPEKRGTLLRRKDQLRHVAAIVLNDGMDEVPSDIQEVVPNADYEVIRTTEALIAFIEKRYLAAAAVKGLILTGGASSRMGQDKSELNYHGIRQWQYLMAEIEKVGLSSFFSVKSKTSYPRDEIEDRILGIGPVGGILSAMLEHPDNAFLVVACDMPNVRAEVFQELLRYRNPSKAATCFFNAERGWPEPLCAIWEPKALHEILRYLALGKTCPRKLLSDLDVQKVNASQANWLENINTPEEKAGWKNQ